MIILSRGRHLAAAAPWPPVYACNVCGHRETEWKGTIAAFSAGGNERQKHMVRNEDAEDKRGMGYRNRSWRRNKHQYHRRFRCCCRCGHRIFNTHLLSV